MAETASLENLSFCSSSQYTVVKEIGQGGMGIIFLAEKNTGGVVDQVVLKSLRTIDAEEEEKLRQEANIATMLRHENIVKTYGLENVAMVKVPQELRSRLEQEDEDRRADEMSRWIGAYHRLSGPQQVGGAPGNAGGSSGAPPTPPPESPPTSQP